MRNRAARGGGYHIRAQPRQKVSYRPDEIDLLVAYIVPLDIWYVFPPAAFVNMTSVHLYPNSIQKRSKFEQYREAWEWVYVMAGVSENEKNGTTRIPARFSPKDEQAST